MTFGDILGKGSFGEPFAVAATPWEVGSIIKVWVIDNAFYVSINIYLSPVLFGLLTFKEETEFIIYLKVAGGDLRTRVFFWPIDSVANVNVAVDVVETPRFRTIPDIVAEFTHLRTAYNFERELRVIGKGFYSMREKQSTST